MVTKPLSLSVTCRAFCVKTRPTASARMMPTIIRSAGQRAGKSNSPRTSRTRASPGSAPPRRRTRWRRSRRRRSGPRTTWRSASPGATRTAGSAARTPTSRARGRRRGRRRRRTELHATAVAPANDSARQPKNVAGDTGIGVFVRSRAPAPPKRGEVEDRDHHHRMGAGEGDGVEDERRRSGRKERREPDEVAPTKHCGEVPPARGRRQEQRQRDGEPDLGQEHELERAELTGGRRGQRRLRGDQRRRDDGEGACEFSMGAGIAMPVEDAEDGGSVPQMLRQFPESPPAAPIARNPAPGPSTGRNGVRGRFGACAARIIAKRGRLRRPARPPGDLELRSPPPAILSLRGSGAPDIWISLDFLVTIGIIPGGCARHRGKKIAPAPGPSERPSATPLRDRAGAAAACCGMDRFALGRDGRDARAFWFEGPHRKA